jgi:hypothetical protein
MVMQLTDDAVLRTFFTLYFMAEEDSEKAQIEQTFWNELELLPDSEKKMMKEKLRQTLFNVQPIVDEFRQDVEAYVEKWQPRKAA